MEYKIYKFNFTAGVHFGGNSLEDGGYTLCADTIFSALCQECLKQGAQELERLVSRAREGKIRVTDAFPFIGDDYYLPKPMLKIEKKEQQGDSTLKKAYKKLSYVPARGWKDYIDGNLDVIQELNRFQKGLGRREIKVSASIRGMEETTPYRVGIYRFWPESGLYLIAGGETREDIEIVEGGLDALRLSGIGGKRSAGLGRYELKPEKVPEDFLRRLQVQDGSVYMALSVCLPKEEELEEALNQADYLLLKRSGFVVSETYAKDQMRKRDLYVMQAGSCFRNRFEGDIYDVSGKGAHPVYRYAKPLFLEVVS